MKLRHRLTLIAIVSALASTMVGIAAMHHIAAGQYLQSSIERLKHETRVHVADEISTMRRAENSLIVLADLLKKSLARPPLPGETEAFDRLTSKDEFGVIRNRKERFDGTTEAGLFMAPDVKLTDREKRVKLRAMQVLTDFGAGALRHFDGVWFDQLNKTSVIFWRRDPDFIYKLPPDHDYTKTLWNQLASPELNPQRIPRWTPAILESPVGVWVVSAVYPLDIDGKWEGIVGHDIALTGLLRSFRDTDSYASTEHFLIDNFGNYILAGRWQQALEAKADGYKPDLDRHPQLKSLLEGKTPVADGTVIRFGERDFAVFSLVIDQLQWHYYRLVPVDEVLAPMNRLFTYIALLLSAIGVIIAMMIRTFTSSLVVKRIKKLVEAAREIGAGHLDKRSHIQGDDEIGELGSAIDGMAANLELDRTLLNASETRYRTVLENIKEVVYQTDHAGRFTYLSPAWKQISGVSPEVCIGHELWNFLDPRDRDAKREEFRQLVSGQRTPPCISEYRLQTADGKTRWVEIYIRPMTGGESAYTGSMDDITIHKINQLIDKLFYELGRNALHEIIDNRLQQELVQRLADIYGCDIVLSRIDRRSQGDIVTSLRDNAAVVDRIRRLHPHQDLDQVLLFPDFPDEWRALLRDHGMHTAFAVPLGQGGERLGRIVFIAPPENAFTEEILVSMKASAERVRALLQIEQDQKWLRLVSSALKTAANAIFISRADGEIEWVNAAMISLSGYDRDELVGQTPRIFDSASHPPAFWQHMWTTILSGQSWQHEVINRRKDGSLYPIKQTITPIEDAKGSISHFISVQEDISQIKQTEEQLRHGASHDLLTGLPNRLLMHEHLQHAINTAKRSNNLVGVLFVDLDHFKIVNDSLGHLAGDQLLREVTARLSACLRVGDTLSRLGGDEFVVLLPAISSPLYTGVVAKKMIESLRDPILIGDHELTTGCSIGISLYPLDGEDADTLLKNADTAMYNAKESGRNGFRFYVPDMNARVVKRMALESDLRRAFSQDELELHYQPQAEILTGRIIGVEALLRWRHPQRGMISPVDFIPVAEETGLIVPIGKWVMLHACRQLAAWEAQGLSGLSMAVNVSPRQFKHEAILAATRESLEETGINPAQLELEITESLMLEHVETNTDILRRLHAMGVRLALDDFGTGFSSLGYLRRLPFHVLKIDRTFVNDIGIDADDTAIAVSIIGLAHNLGLSVIAEGVETEEQRNFLRKHKCDFEQGFLLSRPLPPDELAKLLRNTKENTP